MRQKINNSLDLMGLGFHLGMAVARWSELEPILNQEGIFRFSLIFLAALGITMAMTMSFNFVITMIGSVIVETIKIIKRGE